MLPKFQVPLEGFSALQGISGAERFQIHKAYGSSDHLPSARTWYLFFFYFSVYYIINEHFGVCLIYGFHHLMDHHYHVSPSK